MSERLCKFITFMIHALILCMFALPIIAIIVHASAVQEAEREFERQQRDHEVKMHQLLRRDRHDRGRN